MSENVDVELVEGRDYLVRVQHSSGTIESRFQASAGILAQLGLSESEAPRLVEESASYLLEHQPAIDMPPMVDLDDMAAAFDDYIPELQERMSGGSITP